MRLTVYKGNGSSLSFSILGSPFQGVGLIVCKENYFFSRDTNVAPMKKLKVILIEQDPRNYVLSSQNLSDVENAPLMVDCNRCKLVFQIF